ncbi:uncharacterized protein F4812DRAFT_268449 [Daldinia caldariorum]|uniref:uncharacterized protein n=1 Tax=Daldinia caldariorum TaxID=326644 RepID=UPI0020089B56|nr:uncharacterized protein F4812DRAFT_268449 [Daldinia caldariorum]KAI1470514.1 hypothetical protein F4812DRAFT_268449 [Daldinia caldariorum]
MANRGVPKTTEVVPGAAVNIVLKADQRTGRQVSGTVRDVLTRGDHHRGIKVRLTDGRIGRVQSMSTISTVSTTPTSNTISADAAASGGPSTPTGGEPVDSIAIGGPSSQLRGARRPHYRDARLEEPLEIPPEQADLSAYIVPSRRKGKNKNGPKQTADHPDGSLRSNTVANAIPDVTSATATCPVCGEFEGDETAVAHHVAEHFE